MLLCIKNPFLLSVIVLNIEQWFFYDILSLLFASVAS